MCQNCTLYLVFQVWVFQVNTNNKWGMLSFKARCSVVQPLNFQQAIFDAQLLTASILMTRTYGHPKIPKHGIRCIKREAGGGCYWGLSGQLLLFYQVWNGPVHFEIACGTFQPKIPKVWLVSKSHPVKHQPFSKVWSNRIEVFYILQEKDLKPNKEPDSAVILDFPAPLTPPVKPLVITSVLNYSTRQLGEADLHSQV